MLFEEREDSSEHISAAGCVFLGNSQPVEDIPPQLSAFQHCRSIGRTYLGVHGQGQRNCLSCAYVNAVLQPAPGLSSEFGVTDGQPQDLVPGTQPAHQALCAGIGQELVRNGNNEQTSLQVPQNIVQLLRNSTGWTVQSSARIHFTE
ncbi:hypothetical protein D3C73_1223340 [compost metagenome]